MNQTAAQAVLENKALYSAMRRADFALQVRLAMHRKDLRNVDLAERLGVSEANVSRLLKGGQNVSLETMYALADALEEPLSIVVGDIVEASDAAKFDECGTLAEASPADSTCEEGAKVVDLMAYLSKQAAGSSRVPFRPAKFENGGASDVLAYA